MSAAAIGWFRLHGRDLPWRRTHDPYAVLVSELMLQQTTVATVLGYYERFLRRFPDVHTLAAADEQEVLALWAGLGYYRRARLLQQAAAQVVQLSGGVFPDSVDGLQKLPGVGRYTAGAIASFAYDQAAPVVEANTARLLARLCGITGQLAQSTVQKQLWQAAEELLPASRGREHNSALMDLGAMICRPANPLCGECPVAPWCRARKLNQVEQIPAPASRAEKVARRFWGVALRRRDGHYLVRRIPAGEWHAGLFEFPKVPVADHEPDENFLPILEGLVAPAGGGTGLERFAELRYVVTRHRVTLTVWRGVAKQDSGRRKDLLPENYSWKSLGEIAQLPLASAQGRLLQLLLEHDDFFGTATP